MMSSADVTQSPEVASTSNTSQDDEQDAVVETNETMKTRNATARSHAIPLGQPIPLDEHACSVSLPSWSDVVGYEEGDATVTSQLSCGYPRFVYHPYVLELMSAAIELDHAFRTIESKQEMMELSTNPSIKAKSNVARGDHADWDCIVLPSKRAALRARDFILRACYGADTNTAHHRKPSSSSGAAPLMTFGGHCLSSKDNAYDSDFITLDNSDDKNEWSDQRGGVQDDMVRVLDLGTATAKVHAVIFPAETTFAIAAKSYWQHTGEIVSSRRAEVALLEVGKAFQRVTNKYFDIKVDQDEISKGESIAHSPLHARKARWVDCSVTKQKHLCLYSSCDSIPLKTSSDGCEPENNGEHEDPKVGLRQTIADFAGSSTDSVFLYPSGMASIYAALRMSRRRRLNVADGTSSSLGMTASNVVAGSGSNRGGTSIVYGFPYLDTLKLCGRPELCPDGVEFFGNGNARDLASLSSLLERRARARGSDGNNSDAGICALITEFPSNPLLNCHDLLVLRELADRYNFVLVVDDTIANFANVDLLTTGIADVVCTSLTKLFNGRGDAIGGSLVVSNWTKYGKWIRQDLAKHHFRNQSYGAAECERQTVDDYDDDLFRADAAALFGNSRDFLHRSSVINETAERLSDWFYEHDDVKKVYYPKFTQPQMFNRLFNTRLSGMHKPGYGGLISIILEPHMCQRKFYDTLELCKGPSLGTNFTLVCPYTLLAHYHELEFARAYNVLPNLIRIAVGMEEFGYIRNKFDDALRNARLYPKLQSSSASLQSDRQYSSIGTRREYCSGRWSGFSNTCLSGRAPRTVYRVLGASRVGMPVCLVARVAMASRYFTLP